MVYKKITDNCTMMRATWSECLSAVKRLKEQIPNIYSMTGVYGIPRGGLPFAVAISEEYAIPLLLEPKKGCLIVDDDVGTGKSISKYLDAGYLCTAFACLDTTPQDMKKKVILMTPIRATEGTWLAYPWTSLTGDALKLLREAEKAGMTVQSYIEMKGLTYSPEAFDKAQKIIERSKR